MSQQKYSFFQYKRRVLKKYCTIEFVMVGRMT